MILWICHPCPWDAIRSSVRLTSLRQNRSRKDRILSLCVLETIAYYIVASAYGGVTAWRSGFVRKRCVNITIHKSLDVNKLSPPEAVNFYKRMINKYSLTLRGGYIIVIMNFHNHSTSQTLCTQTLPSLIWGCVESWLGIICAVITPHT